MAERAMSRVELLQGTLELLILRTLLPGPSHGHAIAKHIQRTSEELLQVETGSLYPALHRLEAKGWIAASWELSEKGKRARYYRLTRARSQAARERAVEMAGVRACGGSDSAPRAGGRTMRSVLRKLLWWTRREQKEAELHDELQFHLDEEADDRRSDGLGDDEARRAARLDLGNPLALREQVQSEWGLVWIEQLGQDLRYAVRAMRSNRAFTALTVLSLALGIGANTAIYSFMDAVLMRSLPVEDPASLVVVNWRSREPTRDAKGDRESVMHSMSGSVNPDGEGGLKSGIFPFPAFELFQKHSDAVFSSLFAYYPNRGVNLLIDGQADVGRGEYVSGDYFGGLAVRPAAGRLLGPDDDRVGAPPAVVVSLAFSERHFGGADRAPGRSIQINAVPFTIAGVTPPDFFGVDPSAAPDFYLPLHTNLVVDAAGLNGVTKDQYLAEDYYWLEMMARLRPGVSREEAQAALTPVFHRWATTTAHKKEELTSLPELRLVTGATGIDTLRREYSKPLYLLLMLVGLILALACANTANLLLARSSARRREMAVRLSIGAGRFRVIRQLLTESLVLALLGGALGVVLAAWGVRVLTLLLANEPDAVPMRAGLNWHVLLATLIVSVLCGVLFGLAPAIQSTRPDVMPALKEMRTAPAGSGRGRRWLSPGRTLVMSQIAMALVLLVTAGLFVRTLSNLYPSISGIQRTGRAAVRRQCTPGWPPGSRDRNVLREPAQGAVGDSWRAVGHTLASLNHLSRHSTADHGRWEGGTRHAFPQRRSWLLHGDADSDAARPRDRPAGSRRHRRSRRGQRTVCDGELRRRQPHRPAHHVGRSTPARHGNRRCIRECAISGPQRGVHAHRVRGLHPGRLAATRRNDLCHADQRRPSELCHQGAGDRAACGRARARDESQNTVRRDRSDD